MLSATEVEDLTLRFLFGDSAGPKATGPSGGARRATLGLVVTGDTVRRLLWPSRRLEIKALLQDRSICDAYVDVVGQAGCGRWPTREYVRWTF